MKNLTDQQIAKDKTNTIMNIVAKRAGYYRHNLDKFCYDYLGITNLKWFQKILLWMMNEYDNFLFLGCRGIGKTYMCSLYAVCRCILYPGQLCLVVSSSFKQAKLMIEKITDDFMLHSPLLRNEISRWSTGQNDCYVNFKNGSSFRAITATESSRGYRSHILLLDERRLLSEDIVSSILRPMNATPRQPGYLSKPQYSQLAEMPKELSLTSAFYSMSPLYDMAKSYFANMFDSNLSFGIVDLPYQVSIKEGLLIRQQILNEMADQTFSDIIFSMEREGRFYGSSADALFDFKTLNERRVISNALFGLDYYKDRNVKIPEKQKDELRILSVDIALLASKKHDNDSSCLMIHSAIPTSNNDYIDNIVYIDSQEGLVTDDLGLLIMRYYYQYDCDYIAIDANGIGQACLDFIQSTRFDPLYSTQYQALNVMNNADLAERCKEKNAPKAVYAIKASARSNNDMCLALRAGFQNGYINLLVDDTAVEDSLTSIRGYSKMSETQQARLRLPYIQTSFLINELINLTHDTSNGLIKVKEKSGMRKDRYSSCEYGWALIQELSKNLKPKESVNTLLSKFTSQIRPSKMFQKK